VFLCIRLRIRGLECIISMVLFRMVRISRMECRFIKATFLIIRVRRSSLFLIPPTLSQLIIMVPVCIMDLARRMALALTMTLFLTTVLLRTTVSRISLVPSRQMTLRLMVITVLIKIHRPNLVRSKPLVSLLIMTVVLMMDLRLNLAPTRLPRCDPLLHPVPGTVASPIRELAIRTTPVDLRAELPILPARVSPLVPPETCPSCLVSLTSSNDPRAE
jgi:hypothetical protein